VLKRARPEAADVEEIRRLVVRYEGVEYALERAHAYAQTAKEDLELFADSDDKETLILIADFVVDRDR
jgi:geranylgeranyl pyrophosphate synthase